MSGMNEMERMADRRKDIIKVATLYAFLLILTTIFLQWNYEGYFALKLYFLLIFPLAAMGLILLLVKSMAEIRKLVRNEKNGALALVALLVAEVIAVLPMLTQSYLFMDELWSFQEGGITSSIIGGIPYGRPLVFFPFSFYDGISWANSYRGRIVSTCIALLITLFIFLWIYKMSKSVACSFVLALFTCVTSSMMDMVSFMAAASILWGLLFSIVSILSFHEAVETFYAREIKSLFWLIASLCALVLGFNCYAIATPIVFFFLGVYVFYRCEGKKIFSYFTTYAGVFLVSILIYYLSVLFFCDRYDIVGQVANRGSISFSPEFLIQKIKWFVTAVLPQGIYRILDALTFGRITVRNNLFWETSLIGNLGWMLCGLFFAFILIGVVLFFRHGQREGLTTFVLEILLTIASFYPFLILPESNYMSYYAFPCFCMSCLLFVIAALGFYRTVVFKAKNIHLWKQVFIVGAAILFAVEFNVYSNTAWVQYNTIPFTVAKTEILNQYQILKEKRQIYVIGAAAPVQLDSFSIQMIQQVLLDLGENIEEYRITCTLNDAYSTGIAQNIFEKVYEQVSQSERDLLNRCYSKDLYYGIYWAVEQNISPEDAQVLKQIFINTGVIPTREEAVWVDLRSINAWRTL